MELDLETFLMESYAMTDDLLSNRGLIGPGVRGQTVPDTDQRWASAQAQ